METKITAFCCTTKIHNFIQQGVWKKNEKRWRDMISLSYVDFALYPPIKEESVR